MIGTQELVTISDNDYLIKVVIGIPTFIASKELFFKVELYALSVLC